MTKAMLAVLPLIAVLMVASCSVKMEAKVGDPASTTSTDIPSSDAQTGEPDDAAPATPKVVSVQVGDAYDEASGMVTNETAEFAPDTAVLYVRTELTGCPTGATVKGALIAVSVIDTEGNLIQNHEALSQELEAPASECTVNFTFSVPDSGWPVGEYVVELSVDGQVVDEVELMCDDGSLEM